MSPNPSRDTTAGRVFNDLRTQALRERRPTDELLVLYTLERFLYRLSISRYAHQFILKDGLLLAVLDARRPTRDADLLARQLAGDPEAIVAVVTEIAKLGTADATRLSSEIRTGLDDGVVFDTTAVRASTIRDGDHYTGLRVILPALIARSRTRLALDINFGDPVTPDARHAPYPQLLAEHGFDLLTYPVETVLAEKLTTALNLGALNTRERDYADVWRLTGRHDLDGTTCTEAVERTAAWRGIGLRPLSMAIGSLASRREVDWRTWRAKQNQDAGAYPDRYADVLTAVIAFADPLLTGQARHQRWHAQRRYWSAIGTTNEE